MPITSLLCSSVVMATSPNSRTMKGRYQLQIQLEPSLINILVSKPPRSGYERQCVHRLTEVNRRLYQCLVTRWRRRMWGRRRRYRHHTYEPIHCHMPRGVLFRPNGHTSSYHRHRCQCRLERRAIQWQLRAVSRILGDTSKLYNVPWALSLLA